jgi:hypothetical protein
VRVENPFGLIGRGLLLALVNLPFHEFGHILFRPFPAAASGS